MAVVSCAGSVTAATSSGTRNGAGGAGEEEKAGWQAG